MDEAAEYLLGRTRVGKRVPEEARAEIDAILRRPATERPTVTQVWRDLKIKERFGVGEYSFKEYARIFRTVDRDAVRAAVVKEVVDLLVIPAEFDDRLRRVGQVLLMTKMAKVLREESVPAAHLARLVEAMAKGQEAAVRQEKQKLAVRESRREAEAARRRAKARGDDLSLEERVRRIYGFDVPKAKDAGGVSGGVGQS